MKKIFISILAVALFASCDSYLDTVPDNRMEIDNSDKITKLLVSAYSTNSPVMLAELSSDNVLDNGAQYDVYGQNSMDAYLWKDETTEESDAVKNLWQGHYSAIASANQALEAIDKLGNPSSLNPQKAKPCCAEPMPISVWPTSFARHIISIRLAKCSAYLICVAR